MKYILTKKQSQQADETAMLKYGIPSLILMENASRSIHDEILKKYEICFKKIFIFCGSGNNGGDGFALARHLACDSEVFVFWIGDEEKMSLETANNFRIIKKMGIRITQIADSFDMALIPDNPDLIIDALIGVGGSENLRGKVVEILKKINSIDCTKIAVDIPTGLNSDTGAAHKNAFKADATITMFAPKLGLYLNEGPELAGNVIAASIGAPTEIITETARIKIIENKDFEKLLPKRFRNSSKFDFGRVAIVAGSRNMPGAASLSANAAIKSGSGLVELITPERHSSLLPELICHLNDINSNGYLGWEDYPNFKDRLEKAVVIAIGPGLGNSLPTLKLVEKIINDFKDSKKLVIDADGLKAIHNDFRGNPNICITPHYGEFSKITGIPISEIKKNTYELARDFAKKSGCIVLLKGNPSIITDGESSFLNTTGNPGMATAGSGDVLTGIITSFAGQINGLFDAAAAGAFVHGLAGDRYNENHSQLSLTASDLIEYIKFVV